MVVMYFELLNLAKYYVNKTSTVAKKLGYAIMIEFWQPNHCNTEVHIEDCIPIFKTITSDKYYVLQLSL